MENTRNVKALAVGLSDNELSRLNKAVEGSLAIETVRNAREAGARLASGNISVVITSDELPDGGWRCVLDHVKRLSTARVVVASRLPDERLWCDAVDSGCHDVLATPFDLVGTRFVIQGALQRPLPWQ